MPHYFTDLQIDDLEIPDQEGSDVTCLKQARDQAVEALRLAIDSKARSEEHCRLIATVRDDRGATVYHATLSFNGAYTQNSRE